jgi:hypothetical protein
VSFYAKAMAIRYNKSNTSSISDEQGRCLAAPHRRLDLGTNHGVAVAMPIAAMTVLRRQSNRGAVAHPPRVPGASNSQVNIKFPTKQKRLKILKGTTNNGLSRDASCLTKRSKT